MHFHPKALLLFVAIFLFLGFALSSGSAWKPAAEAASTVLILLGLVGFMREGRRTR